MAKIDISKIKLTKEEKQLLTKNKDHLCTAAKSNYTLPVYQKDLIAMNDFYMKHFDSKGINTGCPKCQLRLLSTLYEVAKANGIVE